MRFPANRRISPGTSAIPPSTFRALRKSPSFVHSLNTIRHSSPAAVAAANPRSESDYELKNHTIGNYHERTKAIGSSETRAAHGPDTAQPLVVQLANSPVAGLSHGFVGRDVFTESKRAVRCSGFSGSRPGPEDSAMSHFRVNARPSTIDADICDPFFRKKHGPPRFHPWSFSSSGRFGTAA